jgi:hypothetical protein
VWLWIVMFGLIGVMIFFSVRMLKKWFFSHLFWKWDLGDDSILSKTELSLKNSSLVIERGIDINSELISLILLSSVLFKN